MKKRIFLLLTLTFFCIFIFIGSSHAGKTKLAILKYKGGDWYSVIGAVKNFIVKANELSSLELDKEPEIVELRDRGKLFTLPILILNGHGKEDHNTIILDQFEIKNLRDYLKNGGFLLINDDYGLDYSVQMLIEDLFPELELTELTYENPLFKSYYQFLPKPKHNNYKNNSAIVYSNVEYSALPKVHEHYPDYPKAYGLFINKRLVLLYIFNSDIADGWEPDHVHPTPKGLSQQEYNDIRKKAIQFGINILYYVLSN